MKIKIGDIIKYENKERFWTAIVVQKINQNDHEIFIFSSSEHFTNKFRIYDNLDHIVNHYAYYYKFLNK